MADRRMFSKKITDTDAFLDMPASTQNLYFHLNMHADDDGFLGNAKTIKRMVGASDDDLKMLVAKEFLIVFDDGIVVIKDWHIHNYIRKDRYTPTIYKEHSKELNLNDDGKYQFGMSDGIPSGNQVVYQMETQDRLGKDRLGKDSKEIYSPAKSRPSSGKPDDIPFNEIVDYLNRKTSQRYRASSQKTRRLIKARFNEGFSLDDFKHVIDTKTADWLTDEKMSRYLRPETLFGTKFENYLNEKTQRKEIDSQYDLF